MNRTTSRAGGDWFSLEQKWDKFLQTSGNKIEELKIKVDYDLNGRPTKFTLSWKENGNLVTPTIILNP